MTKIVIVTGASSGIGEAVVAKSIEEGYRVYAVAREIKALEKLVSRHGAASVEIFSIDVTADDLPERIMGLCERAGENLYGLVNSAGAVHAGLPLAQLPVADYDRIFAVNSRAPFLMMQVFANHIIEHGLKGSIVNVASVGGMRAMPLVSAYCASKAALIAYSQAAALELIPHGIRVNVLAPGITDTPMVEAVAEEYGIEKENFGTPLPAGRLATPEEIAEGVCWLLGERASYNVGTVLNIDGGQFIK